MPTKLTNPVTPRAADDSRPDVTPISPDKFAKEMAKAAGCGNVAGAEHLMAETIRSLGYGAGLDIYNDVEKWRE